MIDLCIVNVSDFGHASGGSELQNKYLIEYIDKFHKDIQVTLLTRCNEATGYKRAKAATWIAKDERAPRFRWLEGKSVKVALQRIRPDVIYQRRGFEYTGFVAQYCLSTKTKMIWHIAHNSHVEPIRFKATPGGVSAYIKGKIRDFGIRNANYVIAQTMEQARGLKKVYGRDCDLVLPNFHPVPDFSETHQKEKRSRDTCNIVWIANFRPFKRPELFLEMAKKFRENKNVRFFMAGRLGDDKWSRIQRDEIRKNGNIEYLGHLSLDQVDAVLQWADIFVSTSSSEGFPNTFIQAWMRKVPILSLGFDPDDVIKKENLGLYSDTVISLVENAKTLIDNPELRHEIGDNAWRYVKEKHGISNAEKIVDIVRQSVEDKKL